MQNAEILKGYEKTLELQGYKQRGIEEKVRDCRVFIDYLEENQMLLAEIGIKEAERYREHLSLSTDSKGKSRYKAQTINKIISHLRGFFRYLLVKGLVYHNPFLSIDKMKVGLRVIKNILNVEQTKKLLNNIQLEDTRDFKLKVIVEVLYATGARISEIEKLEPDDVDLNYGYIVIRHDKAGKDRKVPLTEYAAGLLKLYIKTNKAGEKIFTSQKARSLNKWVNHRLKRITKKLKLPVITCHGIRHSIATQMFRKGADIREIQEYLGHQDIKGTEVYTRVLIDDLKKILQEKHPRERTHEA